MRLEKRVSDLEARGGNGWSGPVAWIVGEVGDARGDAIARYEQAEGPIGERPMIVWLPVSGARAR